jgi:gluconate kinase
MGGACSKHGGGKLHAEDWWQKLNEIYALGDSQRSSWVDNIQWISNRIVWHGLDLSGLRRIIGGLL